MGEWFIALNPIIQALLAAFLTWIASAIGTSIMFFVDRVTQKTLNIWIAFTGGVMLAVSVLLLFVPGYQIALSQNIPAYIPVIAGFIIGGFFIFWLDRLLRLIDEDMYFIEIKHKRTRYQTALILHSSSLANIPKGLAIGVAFGALVTNFSQITLAWAITVTVAIACINIPQGAAVTMSLRRYNLPKGNCLYYGQLAALVETVAAVIGSLIIFFFPSLLPFAFSFVTGAIIYVVVKEVIPNAQRRVSIPLATFSFMFGFAVLAFLTIIIG